MSRTNQLGFDSKTIYFVYSAVLFYYFIVYYYFFTFLKLALVIDYFRVVCSVTWPLNAREVASELVMIAT